MSITDHLVVVAIELGRLESGYAISTLTKSKITLARCSIRLWHDQCGMQYSKIPTSILFDPKKNFNSFGLEAVQRYSDLVSEKEQQNWLFFPHFKMQLYKKSISDLNLTLESENGETMDAVTVYSAAIRYLKDHCLENYITFPVIEEDVLFVLPIPAIWSEQAKKFMREAAEKAGIKKDNILIVLESDAAALHCEYFSRKEIASSDVKPFRAFQPGSKYIVIDAEATAFSFIAPILNTTFHLLMNGNGPREIYCANRFTFKLAYEYINILEYRPDGSIDITAHEVKRNDRIKEVLKVNDVSMEVTRFEEAFRALLEDLFGEKTIQEFCQEHEHDMLDFFERVAKRKRTTTPELRNNIFVQIPIVLNEIIEKLNNGKGFDLAFENKPKYAGKISFLGDKLKMDPAIAKDLFTDTMNNIVCHMRKLMQDEVMRDAEFILMVGGFSEAPMLVHAIREAFPQKVMIRPTEAGFSVMRGALNLGHLQLEIDHRAGIEKEHLCIALEPEAASLFCKHVPVEKLSDSSVKSFDAFQPGSKYIVLDAGGGTIDITVHEVEGNGKLKEIHKAYGGAWGGTRVDDAFRALLEDLFGEGVIKEFSEEHKYHMLEVLTEFEIKKRTITSGFMEKIALRIPTSLTDTFREFNKEDEFEFKTTLL